MMGRTHSVHAEPTTLGMKIAGWAFEIARDRARLAAAADDAATGKISGPVGTYSHLEPRPRGRGSGGARQLRRDPISTQIVQRDRHAASWPRSPSPAAAWSASPRRSATSSTPRSAS
jgi:adenylosuccinate lyase